MLTLVTGNKGKFESAQRRLAKYGIEISMQKIDLIEIQSSSITEVATDKVKQAYEVIQKPVLVSDTGWQIPALKGFPGPFMHFIDEWFETADWFNLMQDKPDRSIIMQDIVAYFDGKDLQLFETMRYGKILNLPKGNDIPIRQIVTFRKDELSIAECRNLNIDAADEGENDNSAWKKFGEWYGSSLL